jgi:hypothetical protein
MLAKKPKDRPSNMQEVFAEIRSINFFKTDMEEHAKAAAAAKHDTFKDSMAHRLDSRTDATRTPEQLAAANVIAKEKARKIDAARKESQAARTDNKRGSAPAAPAPVPQPMPQMMPAPYPMAPGFPMPMPAPAFPMAGMPMPGMPMPGMPMPGMPMPGFPMPGAQFPPQPQMPGQPMPGQPMPHPAAAPPAQPQAAGQGRPQPAAAAPQPPAAAPQPAAATPPRRKSPKPVVDHASIPMMEEGDLPDVQ